MTPKLRQTSIELASVVHTDRYWWLGETEAEMQAKAEILAVVGPVIGRLVEERRTTYDDAFVDSLAARLGERLYGNRFGEPEPEPVLCDYAEAAKLLSTTVDALKKRVKRFQMPEGAVVRTGRRVQFKVEALRKMQPSRRKVTK